GDLAAARRRAAKRAGDHAYGHGGHPQPTGDGRGRFPSFVAEKAPLRKVWPSPYGLGHTYWATRIGPHVLKRAASRLLVAARAASQAGADGIHDGRICKRGDVTDFAVFCHVL